ncbi:hypothetical protein DPEC_G00072740 [Dallia pectoralis]|uniref:Uncharacterized protein n=1 Tax=Dallia pectoralis TaxID=75939 RepID=A0ACC2H3G9_DALPE|nr:hypothetical protein DPEC_G00072740 [Dallia pectoralis]
MDSPCSIILAVFAICLTLPTTSANNKFGCLFEDELCTPYEFCVNDRVFGRCLDWLGSDRYTYEVSAAAQQNLRTVLQKLAHRGLTWQDDATQQVISRELSKLRKVPIRRPDPSISSITHHGGDRKLKPGEAVLSGRVQKYLQELGVRPQTFGAGRPGTQEKRPLTKNQGFQTKNEKTSLYNLQSSGLPKEGTVYTQGAVGSWRPPVETAWSSQEPESIKGNGLAAQLEHYLAGATHTQSRPVPGAVVGSVVGPKGKLHYLSYVSPVHPGGQNKAQTRLDDNSSKPPRPNLDMFLYEVASNHPVPKEPLSMVDERFIQNVVNQLGRQRVNVDGLMGKDLDQLSGIIFDALQVVDGEGPRAKALPRLRGLIRERQMKRGPLLTNYQDMEDQDATVLTKDNGDQMKDAHSEQHNNEPVFINKLLEYLNMDPFSGSPNGKMNIGGSTGNHSMENLRTVGLEDVKSRTTQGQVLVPHPWEERKVDAVDGGPYEPDNSSPDQPIDVQGSEFLVDTELERWIHGTEAPPPEVESAPLKDNTQKNHLTEPQKKDMRLQQEELLHVGVKAFSKSPHGKDHPPNGKDHPPNAKDHPPNAKDHPGDFGYIITDTDSLTSHQGLDLMERLGRWVDLRAANFLHLSVLGPAVTFRVGSNANNVSAADLIRIAGRENRNELFATEMTGANSQGHLEQ